MWELPHHFPKTRRCDMACCYKSQLLLSQLLRWPCRLRPCALHGIKERENLGTQSNLPQAKPIELDAPDGSGIFGHLPASADPCVTAAATGGRTRESLSWTPKNPHSGAISNTVKPSVLTLSKVGDNRDNGGHAYNRTLVRLCANASGPRRAVPPPRKTTDLSRPPSRQTDLPGACRNKPKSDSLSLYVGTKSHSDTSFWTTDPLLRTVSPVPVSP